MKCPNCGATTEVTETREKTGGGIRRRRRCPLCGQRITTVELVVPERARVDVRHMALVDARTMRRAFNALGALRLQIMAWAPEDARSALVAAAVVDGQCSICGGRDGSHLPGCEIGLVRDAAAANAVLRNIANQDGEQ